MNTELNSETFTEFYTNLVLTGNKNFFTDVQ